MATKTFLTEQQTAEALKKLKSDDALSVSHWLGELLEARLSKHPKWQSAKPYRLGSWARGELCAKSDIDLLFIGDEADVKKLVQDFQLEGIKIRYRVPADLKDWTKNVDAFDVLALLNAQPFFKSEDEPLKKQLELISSRGVKYRRELFREMLKERKERARRYDSIANFLEPNLKYGPGGLRDLEQGLMIRNLFAENFTVRVEADAKLQQFKGGFLKIRHFLHLLGGGDILASAMQKDLAEHMGYESVQSFMTQVEANLGEVSFYADWMAEAVQVPKKQLEALQKTEISNFEDAIEALKKDSSVLMQQQIRESDIRLQDRKKIGRGLEKYFTPSMDDKFLQALFRSQILTHVIPSLKRVTGQVQHDQYHRYSVDAHTLQAVREVLRVKRKPKSLGRLAKLVQELTTAEWEVLLWSALYHDLGKGLKGDHSTEGAQIVKQDLIAMGASLKLTAQVTWMVKNHLIMSGAAFRQNPQSSSTWAELFRRGVKGRRILKLAIFTAIDIRATNPEAWNEWKEKLLFDLAEVLRSPKASQLSALLDLAEKKKIAVAKDFVENLDPQVIESVPQSLLLKDYTSLKKQKTTLPPLVVRNRKKETWVRFHSREDKSGLFLAFTSQLHASGLSVQEAFVQTYSEFGAYDWFKVKTTKSVATIKAMLNKEAHGTPVQEVHFAVVDVVSQDNETAILSFRGEDQRGALLAAAKALYDAGLDIQSAKVHTWGRQIDDIFTVRKGERFTEVIEQIMRRVVT